MSVYICMLMYLNTEGKGNCKNIAGNKVRFSEGITLLSKDLHTSVISAPL